LLAMRAQKMAPVRAGLDLAHRSFLAGTALVVWATHRAVLKKAGYGLWSFVRACDAQYRFYLLPPLRLYQRAR
jgi:hypothetical protein